MAFTAMSIGVRFASPTCPISEIVLFRSLVALAVLIGWLTARGEFPAHLRTLRPLGHLGRGLSGSAGMFANFASLSLLPLADATAYFYASPIFVTLIAALGLRENVHASRWAAVAIGFAGVLLMLSGHFAGHFGLAAGQTISHAEGVGAIVALAGAGFAALSIIQTRRLTSSEHTGAIVFYFSLLTTAAGALMLLAAQFWGADWPGFAAMASQRWVTPDARAFYALIGIGVAGGGAQILVTQSYRYADASLLASFDYLAMLWALLASLVLFGERPAASMLLGAGAIAASGLLAIFGEKAFRGSKRAGAEAGIAEGFDVNDEPANMAAAQRPATR